MTKDGVTVAKAIELTDPLEKTGAQMVKEVANKTSDERDSGRRMKFVGALAMQRNARALITCARAYAELPPT